RIAEEFGLQMEIDPELGKEHSSFEFYKEGWPVSIYFYFKSELDEIILGVNYHSKKTDWNNVMTPESQENLVNQLINEIDQRLSIGGNWIWVGGFEKLNLMGWSNINYELPNKIREKVRDISEVLDRFP